jgi:hypothetical protein
MPHYHVYLLNTEKRITAVREIDCADDDAALARAACLMDGHAGAEVRLQARLVGQVLRDLDEPLGRVDSPS